MNCRQLKHNLEAAGKPALTWESRDGTQVLVLPHGGRVLGVFAPGGGENFLWTHAALATVESAKIFYRGEQWQNSGGERTWLAPEVDFFFPDYPKLDRYWQQRELDPGSYEASREDGVLVWKNRANLSVSRTRQQVPVEMIKTLSPAPNPLRHEKGFPIEDLSFAGYTLGRTLNLIGPEYPPYIGLWSLTQMPHGGDLLVPTLTRAEPEIYMGKVDDEDLLVADQLVRYRMRAAGEHKLGIRAVALTGRAGYLYPGTDGETCLIVRNFNVNPSGDYADVPWGQPDNFGFAFQACNVNSNLGAFSELEYHVPAIGAQSGCVSSVDQSQLWAFRGPEAVVQLAARQLLGADRA